MAHSHYQDLIHPLDYSYEDATQMATEFGSVNTEADEMAKKLKEEENLTY